MKDKIYHFIMQPFSINLPKASNLVKGNHNAYTN